MLRMVTALLILTLVSVEAVEALPMAALTPGEFCLRVDGVNRGQKVRRVAGKSEAVGPCITRRKAGVDGSSGALTGDLVSTIVVSPHTVRGRGR